MSIRSVPDPQVFLGAPPLSVVAGVRGASERGTGRSSTVENPGRSTPWGHNNSVRTRPQASGLLSDPPLIHPASPRPCVDARLVDAAYTAVRLARALRPRGFVVLGERFSTGWLVACVAVVLAMSIATCAEERDAARERHQLEHQALTSAELAVHALGEEAQCEAVVAACTQALGHGESCSCWLDEDGQGGTWR